MSEKAKLTIHQQAELTNIWCEDIVEIEELTPQALRLELDKLKSDTEKDKACRAILSAAWTNTSNLMIELAQNPTPAAQPAQTPQSWEQPPAGNTPQSPETNPEILPAPPQSLRDIMYAVKVGFLPITIADPAFLKDWKIGKFQKWVQWIYVWPSKAVAGIQSIFRSMGDENYKKLIIDEMDHLAKEFDALNKKLPKARKDQLEKAIASLKWIDAELLRWNKDWDKAALALFDEYLKLRWDIHVHTMHIWWNANTESIRLKTELTTIETDILARTQDIDARTEAIKVLNEWGHHALIMGSTAVAPIESLAELNRKYDEAILAVKEWRDSTLSKPLIEIEREHNVLIEAAKKIDVNVTSGTMTVKLDWATKSSIDSKINALKSDPAYTEWAPKNIPGKKGNVIFSPATTEYTAISDILMKLEAEKDKIDNAVNGAEKNKSTALKPYTDKKLVLEDEKAKKVWERNRRITELEREKTRIEGERTKKSAELTETDAKYRDRILKLAEIDKETNPVRKERLSQEYDRMIATPRAWSTDETRRRELADKTKTRTERSTDIGARAAELEREKAVFDKERSLKYMASIEGKITVLQAEAAKLATDIDAAAAKSGDAETYKRKLFEEVNRINGEIEKLNVVWKKEVATWADLPKVELEKMLTWSKLWNHIYGVSKWLIKFDEKVMNQKHVAWTMRWVYGFIALAWVGWLGMQAAKWEWKSAWLDAADIGLGFIPGYDLYMAMRWKDLNGRPIEGKDLWARVGFGTLALVPWVWAIARTAGLTAVKAAGKADKAIDVINTVRAVEQSTQVVWKIGSAGYLGYTLIDITKQTIEQPVETITRAPHKIPTPPVK